ncbi:reticulon-3-like, partial [Uloborus diversus]|uniref:reticulon-3-like n=1 Tax=Uloborus diversus TaxID=327109 RepID=UPI00240A9B24
MEGINPASFNSGAEDSNLSKDLLGNDSPLLDFEGLEALGATKNNVSAPSSGIDALDDFIGNSQSGLVSTTRPLVTSSEEDPLEFSKGASPTSNLLDYANADIGSSLIESGADTRVEDSSHEQRGGGDRLLIDDDLLADDSDFLISAPAVGRNSPVSPNKKTESEPEEHLPKVKDPKIDDKPKAESDNYEWGNRAYETAVQPAVESEVAMEDQAVGNQSKNPECDCPFAPGAWLNPEKLHPVVADYIYWRDPKKSGVAFGTSLVLLLSLKYFSFISVVAYITLAVLTLTVSFRIYKNVLQAVQKSNDGHPFKDYLEMDIALSQGKCSETVEVLIQHVNCVTGKLRSLVLVEDLVDTLKLVLLAWCLTYVGAWFNGLTLIILGVVAAFTLPKVYETNKAQIDVYADIVRTKGKEVID